MKIFNPKYVYTSNEFLNDAGILVDDDGIIRKICDFQELKTKYPQAEVETWKNMVMVPGGVNVHNHSFQILLRGIAADRPFLEWRDKSLYHYSPLMTKEDIYVGALFCFAEMMKRGVTCVSDFFYLHNFGTDSDYEIIRAAKDLGMRLVLSRTMYDWDGAPSGYVETIDRAVKSTKMLADEFNGKTKDMITVLPSPHSLHAASPDMIVAGHELAKELGTRFHIHVAEEKFEVEQVMREHNGLSTIEYLDKLGVVDEHMMIIHGVYLKPEEIKLMGERGVGLAYCPSSNMFLADGITNIPDMIQNDVLIGLGTDGACGNNRNSVFEEMRMVSILQKAATCDAMCVNYKQAFDMGTINGGKLLGLPVGDIKEGMRADFAGIDLDDLSMLPISENLEQMLANVVYSLEPTAVKNVVINGKDTVHDGIICGISEEELVEKVRDTMKALNAK